MLASFTSGSSPKTSHRSAPHCNPQCARTLASTHRSAAGLADLSWGVLVPPFPILCVILCPLLLTTSPLFRLLLFLSLSLSACLACDIALYLPPANSSLLASFLSRSSSFVPIPVPGLIAFSVNPIRLPLSLRPLSVHLVDDLEPTV